ncbi:YtxH domain-containing protein [Neobacillus niacini]|uniref:YtxH domain-containing protein n=1 Tax=Neobacillus niacini TaxID=86668 RepID=UPI00285A77C3|nr:YtxH domain-containing protein [Neobacillus niacini]MDR6999128.1 gas vesicle protein [Neobacillus niacini]
MKKRNQFWKGMLYGALAGGAISLLDKDTREVMKENILNVSKKGLYIVKHPQEVAEQIKETAIRIKETVEDVSEDISYITEKVEELRELTQK